MKKRHIFFLVIGLILFFAVFTNPDPERHRRFAKAEVKALIKKAAEKNGGEPIGSALDGPLMDYLIDNMVKSHNYILFSTTEVTTKEGLQTIGVGAFGYVYISGKLTESLWFGLMGKE
jgi:hypothetical protein